MNPPPFDNSLLKQVRPNAISKYLESKGWVGITYGDIILYTLRDEQILVPLKPQYSDFAKRIREVLLSLSWIEKREQVSILNELLLPPSDVIKFRLDAPSTKDGTVPFEEGIDLLEGARKAIYAAALNVKEPKKFYGRLRNKEVASFVESCKLAQTERGSFVANIVCPVDIQSDLFNQPVQNFGRKTAIVLMRSLSHISSSLTENRSQDIVDTPEGKPQISYNLCEALLDLKPKDDHFKLHVDVSWAP